jgi:alpha-N-arabinofuranosidase
VSQSLQRISDMIGRYDQTGRIKIAVTEWGPMFHVLPSSPYVDHVKTLGSALYAASVMQSFLLAQRVEVADFFKLSDLLFMGWIGNRQGKWIPNAPYYAFQLYTRHFGNVVVDSTTQVPGYRTRAVGWVDPVSNAPYLVVLASRNTDRKKLYLMAVNRNFDQDIPAAIEIRGARPTGRGVAWILTGSGIDANTGTELPKSGAWARQASDEKNPRFDKGQPDEITLKPEDVSGIAPRFTYVVPKHSVVSLEVSLQ